MKMIISLILVFGIHKIGNMNLPLIIDIPFIGGYIQYLYEFLLGILFLISVFLFLKVAYQSIEELLFKNK